MGKLVYGEVNDGLVFIEEPLANELASLHEALEQARTWDELKSAVSPARWAEIERRVTGGEEEMPPLDEPIDATHPAWRGEGDWPEWPARKMLEWMPADIHLRFGRVEDTLMTGSYLWLDPSSEEEIVEALEEIGWSCEEDEGLVMEASGYG